MRLSSGAVTNQSLCFQMDGKTTHATQCPKSRVLNKVINLILENESFEKQCVIMKGLLQSERLTNIWSPLELTNP